MPIVQLMKPATILALLLGLSEYLITENVGIINITGYRKWGYFWKIFHVFTLLLNTYCFGKQFVSFKPTSHLIIITSRCYIIFNIVVLYVYVIFTKLYDKKTINILINLHKIETNLNRLGAKYHCSFNKLIQFFLLLPDYVPIWIIGAYKRFSTNSFDIGVILYLIIAFYISLVSNVILLKTAVIFHCLQNLFKNIDNLGKNIMKSSYCNMSDDVLMKLYINLCKIVRLFNKSQSLQLIVLCGKYYSFCLIHFYNVLSSIFATNEKSNVSLITVVTILFTTFKVLTITFSSHACMKNVSTYITLINNLLIWYTHIAY